MDLNVLDWLERQAALTPERPCYCDDETCLSFREVQCTAEQKGAALHQFLTGLTRSEKNLLTKDHNAGAPVCVMSGRNVRTIVSFLSVVYSGHAYAPLDAAMPEERIRTILAVAKPLCIVADEEYTARAKRLAGTIPVICYESDFNILQTFIYEQLIILSLLVLKLCF